MFMANVDINLYGVFDSRHVDVCFMHMPCDATVTNECTRMRRAHKIMKSECGGELLKYICSELVRT